MEGKIEYSQFKFPARKGEKLRRYVKFTSSQQISHRWTELVKNSCMQWSEISDSHPG